MISNSHSAPRTLAPADAWLKRAACRDVEPEEMFPDSDAVRIKFAQTVCAACPVTRACLVLALRAEGKAGRDSRYGIFGGLTPRQRHRLHLELRKRRISP
ncbi:Transcriptional regulator WhiB2 [Streptomyces sp. YIM 121038]|uniref:WhiB family transcriptional regulator n=1 Tax=Streptomyces sp. YIM 121038 TaxID=2136401 RepID=UPI001110E845|nr:WhiB family transcriptional regulator [Streptomyces sp. YIM 121038]QCX81104.1 Transcriptional regulator WhiB2 [Streptomyces sp. YIM 121038]